MNVIRHYHISHQLELVSIPYLAKNFHERISAAYRIQERQSPIASTRNEVQIPLPVISFEISRHEPTPTASHPFSASG
jgi:hypothetical protein